MAIVDENYYNNTFLGLPVPAADFPRYNAWAERAISLLTRGTVSEENISSLPGFIQAAYKDAICAQISYFLEEGLSVGLEGTRDTAFTVGKVSVSKGANGELRGGVFAGMACPEAVAILEATGLIGPQIPTFDGWWY